MLAPKAYVLQPDFTISHLCFPAAAAFRMLHELRIYHLSV